MAKGTLLYAQSGGVTAVINASAAAVISQARASKIKVLAARNGILGALREDLIDTSKESAAAIRALAVSYTHLDVYKRQSLACTPSGEPAATSARNRSPVEMCGTCRYSFKRVA